MSRLHGLTGLRFRLPQLGLISVIVFFSWALASPERYFFPGFANTTSDDASYVAYSMSIGLDGDLDFSNEIADRLTIFPNGRVRPVHPAGPGIMAAPIVAAFSVGDHINHHPVIYDRSQLGGSWSYFGFFIASAGALIGGLLLTSRTARAITQSLSPRFFVLVLAGTGLPFYGLKRFTMGHSFEFLTAAIVLWAVFRLRQSERPPLLWMLLLGLGITFSLLVRPANVNIVLLPFLVHLILEMVLGRRDRARTASSAKAWLAGGTVLGLIGTFVANALLYGTPYPSFGQQYQQSPMQANGTSPSGGGVSVVSAVSEFSSDTIPRAASALSRVSDIPVILFTQEFGLLWFMPIVPIGGLLLIVSLVVSWRRGQRRWTVSSIAILSGAYTAVPLGVVLVWQSHASSFGFRYLFSLVPLGLLGLCLFAALPDRPRILPLRPTLGLLAILALFSLIGQVFYGTIPAVTLTVSENSFGRIAMGSPTFASSLIASFVEPQAWANMLARGLPGFALLATLPNGAIASLGATLNVVPQRRADALVDLIARYSSELTTAAPGTVTATLVALGILVPALITCMTRTPSVSRRRQV